MQHIKVLKQALLKASEILMKKLRLRRAAETIKSQRMKRTCAALIYAQQTQKRVVKVSQPSAFGSKLITQLHCVWNIKLQVLKSSLCVKPLFNVDYVGKYIFLFIEHTAFFSAAFRTSGNASLNAFPCSGSNMELQLPTLAFSVIPKNT